MATPAVEFTVVGVDKASKTFDEVGRSASDSADKISRASEDAASKFDAAGESAGDLATWTATLGDGMATLGEQIGGPTGRLLEMGGNAILAATAVGDLGEGAVQAGKWIKGLGIVQKAQAAAAWVATAAQKALNVAMRANPIGLIITGLTLLVAGLTWFFTKTETGRKIVAAAWAGIQIAIEAVGKWFADTLVPWFSNAVTSIAGFFSGAKDTITTVWDVLVEWFTGIPAKIGEAIAPVVAAIVEKYTGARDTVTETFDNLVEWFTGIPKKVGDAIAGVVTWVSEKFTDARDKVTAMFNGLIDWFEKIPEKVGTALATVGGFVKDVFADARDKTKEIFNGLIDWFKDVPEKIGDHFSGVGETIMGAFKSAFNAVAGWWNSSIGDIGFTVPAWVPGVGGKSFDVPNIPMLATGGSIARGGWAVVGEQGPEVVSLPTGSTVYPNGTMPAAAGPTLHIDNFYSGGLTAAQVATELAWELRR